MRRDVHRVLRKLARRLRDACMLHSINAVPPAAKRAHAIVLRGKICAKKMICPSCHSENRDKAKFCDECGCSLESGTPGGISHAVAPTASTAANEATAASTAANEAIAALHTANEPNATNPHNSKLDLTGFSVFDERPPHSGSTEPMNQAQLDSTEVMPSTEKKDDEKDARAAAAGIGAQAVEKIAPEDNTHAAAIATEKIAPEDNTRAASNKSTQADARAAAREEKKRLREMKKHDRKMRRELQSNCKSHKKVIIPAVIMGVIAVVAIVGVAGYSAELWGGKTVPITAGMSEADAIYTLEQAGFSTRVSKVKSDDTEGIVLMTDPQVGTRVAAGSEVVVHVAESRTIPAVVGLDEKAAEVALRECGYINLNDVQYSKTNKTAEGQVLSVDPQENTKAKSTSPVTLTVAQNYKVPDVRGAAEADAIYTLREAGYYAASSYVESEGLTEGTVYSTDPQAGTVLDCGKCVTAYIVQHRSSKLEKLARAYLEKSATVQLGGTTYKVDSVNEVNYDSNGVVRFTIMGSPTTNFFGENITLGSRLVNGKITFNDSNEITSVG